MELSANNLAAKALEILEVLKQDPYLTAFIASRKRVTLGALSAAVQHPAAPVLRKYENKGIPVHTGPSWTQRDLDQAITEEPYTSAYKQEIKPFMSGEIRQSVQDGCSILLSAADVVRLFGDKLKLSCIAAFLQEYLRLRRIINLSAQPNEVRQVSTSLDVMESYHCGMLRLYQVGAFSYVISSVSDNNCIII